mmetsp:Transcript_7996/g.15228  ORF Transcript_7996/g.15228 Transcript_7996/m.15228 type:complete len:276 (-) Transcript_7996:44-871(-)
MEQSVGTDQGVVAAQVLAVLQRQVLVERALRVRAHQKRHHALQHVIHSHVGRVLSVQRGVAHPSLRVHVQVQNRSHEEHVGGLGRVGLGKLDEQPPRAAVVRHHGVVGRGEHCLPHRRVLHVVRDRQLLVRLHDAPPQLVHQPPRTLPRATLTNAARPTAAPKQKRGLRGTAGELLLSRRRRRQARRPAAAETTPFAGTALLQLLDSRQTPLRGEHGFSGQRSFGGGEGLQHCRGAAHPGSGGPQQTARARVVDCPYDPLHRRRRCCCSYFCCCC